MAIIKSISSKASLGKAVKYITNDKKTDKERLVDGKDCNPETAIDEMKATKGIYNKMNGRQYIHYIQSFSPEDKITPEQAHKIGKEFMDHKSFDGYEVVMATHTDQNHLHNHFIVNSVNFENGNKFQSKWQDLNDLKEYSNQICEREGFSIIKEPNAKIRYTQAEKGLIETGKTSWKDEMRQAIDQAKSSSKNYDDFKKTMTYEFGIEIKEGKDFTYTHPDNPKWKARGKKLGIDYERGNIENEFSRQTESERGNDTTSRAEYESKDGVREHTSERNSGDIEDRISEVEKGVGRGNEKDSNNDNRTSPESSDLKRNGKQELQGNRDEHQTENNRDHDELESADRNVNDKPKPRIKEIAEEFER